MPSVLSYLPSDIELRYLVYGGSFLYGTLDSHSDTDIWGIADIPEVCHFSTSPYNAPNTPYDIDILILPEYEFAKRLQNGDMLAVDLLFSYTNKDSIIYGSVDYIRSFRKYLVWEKHHVRDYIYKELKGYPVYGSILYKIRETVKRLSVLNPSLPLWEVLESVEVPLDTYTYKVGSFHRIGINVYGKKIQDVSVGKAVSMLENIMKHRLRMDFRYKNLMHAIRAICEFEEYVVAGEVYLPLKCAPFLKSVKQGFYPWHELIKRVSLWLGRQRLG